MQVGAFLYKKYSKHVEGSRESLRSSPVAQKSIYRPGTRRPTVTKASADPEVNHEHFIDN